MLSSHKPSISRALIMVLKLINVGYHFLEENNPSAFALEVRSRSGKDTPPKTNMYPHKKGTIQKECSSSNHYFQWICLFSGEMTCLKRICPLFAMSLLCSNLINLCYTKDQPKQQPSHLNQLIVTVPPVGLLVKHIPTSPTKWTPGYNSTYRGLGPRLPIYKGYL